LCRAPVRDTTWSLASLFRICLVSIFLAGCGTETAVVPDVRGLSLPEARSQLEQEAFEVEANPGSAGKYAQYADESGLTVEDQVPRPGREADEGSTVTLTLTAE
jgi:beta-lactam-binding protein with PASTA domain